MVCRNDGRVRVHLRDEVTGVMMWADYDPYPYGDDTLLYYWQEGNYSCDCNRAPVFDVDADDVECGDWRYTLWMLMRGDRVLYERAPQEVK